MQPKKQFKISFDPYSNKKVFLKGAFNCNSDVMFSRFSPDDNIVSCGCSDGKLYLFNLNTSNKIAQILTNGNSTPITMFKYKSFQHDTRNTYILVSNADGTITQYNFMNKSIKKLWTIMQQNQNYVYCLDYSPDLKTFATAGKDCVIRIYDNIQKTIITRLQGTAWHTLGHNNRIYALKYQQDNQNIIYSAAWDQNVRMWDIRTKKSQKGIFGVKINGDSLDVCQGILLTGSTRTKQQLQLWNINSQKLIKNISWGPKGNVLFNYQDTQFVFACQFQKIAKNAIIAAGSSQVKLFNYDLDGQRFNEFISIEQLKHTPYTVDFGNISNRFMFGCKGGNCFVFNINSIME